MLSLEQEHRRFCQQAAWTQSARQYVLSRIGLKQSGAVLEVGCGEGVICAELKKLGIAEVHGMDIRAETLLYARHFYSNELNLVNGDGLFLPYRSGAFNVVFCHFALLWMDDPLAVLKEMRRVTCPGGWVAALAEPDYDGRIDYPPPLEQLGALQKQALMQQGADPALGRKLSGLLTSAGLSPVEVGVLGGQWSGAPSEDEWLGEWQVMETDLAGLLTRQELDHYRRLDAAAYQKGERILYVPTFYGWGRVD